MQQTNKWNDQTNNAVEVAIKWDIGPPDHPFRSSYGQMSSLAHWWPNNTFTSCKPTFENLSIRHLNPWFVACDHPQLIDGGRDCGRQQKAWNCESSVICQSSHLLPSPPNAYHQSEAWNNEPLRRSWQTSLFSQRIFLDWHWFLKHLILICTCADDSLNW